MKPEAPQKFEAPQKPAKPTFEDYTNLARHYGGSIFLVGLSIEEAEAGLEGNCPTVYDELCGFTLGVFFVRGASHLEKPTVFLDRSWNRITLSPAQQQEFDANWQHFMDINNQVDFEGQFFTYISPDKIP